jgi:putative tryptophan/tyrosine transport system substrate-binding protein
MFMRRRDFITLCGGAAVVWPFSAQAQQAENIRRLGVLLPFAETDPEVQKWLQAFVEGLRQSGWIDGNNIRIDTHWAGPDAARVSSAAKTLIDGKPDVILANGPLAVAPLRQMTNKIPIVFVAVADPVVSGFVADLARPGGNMTGFTLGEFTISAKMLELRW